MNRFGPGYVMDVQSGRGIGGVVASVTDPTTGLPVATYDLDGDSVQVVSNRYGYFSEFQADALVVRVTFPGAAPLYVSPNGPFGEFGQRWLDEAILRLRTADGGALTLDPNNGTVLLPPMTGGSGGGLVMVDNGDGTVTVTSSGSTTIMDNGDGTVTITGAA